MLFNSFSFVVFLPVVFAIYWVLGKKRTKVQNLILLLSSYVFYSWWDWRFLFLLLFISVSSYFIGILIFKNKENNKKHLWLWIGLILDILTLFVFKYFNFFIDGFTDLISILGYALPKSTLRLILPLGISFYIFLSISYLLDIYKNKIEAEKNTIDVLLSLSFFPIILAGPIQRPSLLLPDIKKKRQFSYDQAVDGLRQFLWGLFMKVVIADNLAGHVDIIFNNYSSYSGSSIVIGVILFSVQIYADFSGYSDMAIGIAKLFGFNLMRNFNFPYFSRDIAEFWKRWNISLTSWFRDYIFLPIAYFISKKIKKEKVFFINSDLVIYIIGVLITWLLTGLWHGANYTFIVWGMIHGFLLIVFHLQKKPRKILLKKMHISNNNLFIRSIDILFTLSGVLFAWLFFKSDSLQMAIQLLKQIGSSSFHFSAFEIKSFANGQNVFIANLFFILFFLVIEFLQRKKQYALEFSGNHLPRVFRYGLYYVIGFAILFYGGGQRTFIYFQF